MRSKAWTIGLLVLIACESGGSNGGLDAESNDGGAEGTSSASGGTNASGGTGQGGGAGGTNAIAGAGGSTAIGGTKVTGGAGGTPATGGSNVTGGTGGVVATGGAGGNMGGTGGTVSPGIDACFSGLRDGTGSVQVATKISADSKYRMRLALETAGRLGTSGTRPWAAFRFGLETPTGNVCISNETALANTYTVSRHNCADVLTITVSNRRYVFANPDSTIDPANPSLWIRPASLRVFVDNQMSGAAIQMNTASCERSSDGQGRCRSGGPC